MKREINLLVEILKNLEKSKEAETTVHYTNFPNYSKELVDYNLFLLIDKKLIIPGPPASTETDGHYSIKLRMSWDGHDWLNQHQ